MNSSGKYNVMAMAYERSMSFLVNGLILLYVMLPGVRNAFRVGSTPAVEVS